MSANEDVVNILDGNIFVFNFTLHFQIWKLEIIYLLAQGDSG